MNHISNFLPRKIGTAEIANQELAKILDPIYRNEANSLTTRMQVASLIRYIQDNLQ